uniref:Uncharacterized protein n=1 Tax=Physcomitrium patens TaxID=3218 RepID=A0A2K1KFK6_PHYPA|nr:hypothetical protein PHYPA_008913 [Physcomitrium patens]
MPLLLNSKLRFSILLVFPLYMIANYYMLYFCLYHSMTIKNLCHNNIAPLIMKRPFGR